MARIRSVKPEFFTSLDTADLSIPARLFFIGTWTYVDDEGRGLADPRLLKAAIHPLDDQVQPQDIAALLDELEARHRIERYEANGRPLFQVNGWNHQKIDRRTASKYPGPQPLSEPATSPRRARDDDSSPDRIGSDRIGSSSNPVSATTPSDRDRGEEAHRFAAVIDRIVTQQMNGKRAGNPKAYRDQCERNARRDHGPKILQLLEQFPTAPPESIAGHVLGEPSNLGMYAS